MSEISNQTRLLHTVSHSCLTIRELAEQLELSTVQVSRAAAQLIARDLLERAERGCFRLTDAGLAAQRDGLEITSGPAGITWRQTRSAAGQGLR